jgi:hypothetical protein
MHCHGNTNRSGTKLCINSYCSYILRT